MCILQHQYLLSICKHAFPCTILKLILAGKEDLKNTEFIILVNIDIYLFELFAVAIRQNFSSFFLSLF